jgi:sec-independent protein translocase protein TatC
VTDETVSDLPSAAPPASPGATPHGADDEKVMSLVEHLSELRRRVAISIAAILVGSIVGFAIAPRVVTLLLEPLPPAPGGGAVQFLTLSGSFYLHLRIAVILGFLLALPVVLYHLWAFVSPGLTPREREAARPWIPLTVVFFLLGAAVAYVTLPYAVTFLVGFQLPGTEVRPSAENYFGFVMTIFLVFGLVMQFPVALVLLSKLGILTVERLRQSRRYVLLIIVVFAVVATPGGDPVSPIVMSAVMYLLYEATIVLLTRSGRPRVSDD